MAMHHAGVVLMVITTDRETPDDSPVCCKPAGNAMQLRMMVENMQTFLHRRHGAESTAAGISPVPTAG